MLGALGFVFRVLYGVRCVAGDRQVNCALHELAYAWQELPYEENHEHEGAVFHSRERCA